MEKQFDKVNYSEYEGKYDERIIEKLEKSPESIDIETMRANLYGYTFTKHYAEGVIPDELSMDYWEEYHFKNNLHDNSVNLDVMALIHDYETSIKDGTEKIYWHVSPQEKLILKAIDSTGDGKTEKTALCIINVHQEYEYLKRVIKYNGMCIVKQCVSNGIDCLVLKDEDGTIEMVYFDISRRFEVGYHI